MKPRITISSNKVEIWLNEAARDLLVEELQQLSERNDHFHLDPEEFDGEVPIESRPYRDSDAIIQSGKVMLRPDKWDAEYFPHVLDERDRSAS